MYNRYQGNSGRVERVPDAPQPSIRPHPPAPPAGNNKPPPGVARGRLEPIREKIYLADHEKPGMDRIKLF